VAMDAIRMDFIGTLEQESQQSGDWLVCKGIV
jgi:hypothetical protein